MSQKPVGIVGGGLAGLACARVLHEHNIPFLLFEASDTLGGRVKSEHVDGNILDVGFQIFLTSYRQTLDLMNVSSLQLKAYDAGAIVRARDRFHDLSDPFRHPSKIFSTLTSSVGNLGDKFLVLKQRMEMQETSPHEFFSRPEETTFDHLQKKGFSSAFIEEFYRPFFRSIFLEENLFTSSRYFQWLLQKFSTGLACVPRKGMAQIPREIAKPLPTSSIRLKTEVKAVSPDEIVLKSGEKISVQKVVVATDQDAARKLVPVLPAPEEWNGTQCLYFESDVRPSWEKKIFLNAEYVRSFDVLTIPTNLHPEQSNQGSSIICVSRIFDGHEFNPDHVLDELHSWFGAEVKMWRPLQSYTVPKALPYVSTFHKKPLEIQKGIFLCGDHMSHSSIEGAVESGLEVGQQIASSLKS
ncbi:MAG: NAD(P)/FAD-dependent oxidoreductase [Bdellovibrionota bacterium]